MESLLYLVFKTLAWFLGEKYYVELAFISLNLKEPNTKT